MIKHMTKTLLRFLFYGLMLLTGLNACSPADRPAYELMITGGTIYDGNGGQPYEADIAIRSEEHTSELQSPE